MKPHLALAALLTFFAADAQAQPAASNGFLCRAQLDMLVDRERVTEAERAVFEAQCSCLEEQEQRLGVSDLASCSQGELGG